MAPKTSPRPKMTPYRVVKDKSGKEVQPERTLKMFEKSPGQRLEDAKTAMRASHTSQNAPSGRVPVTEQKTTGSPSQSLAKRIRGGSTAEKSAMASAQRDLAAKKLGELKGFPSTSRTRGRAK